MDDAIYDALIDLKRSIDKQVERQEETNDVMRALIGTLRETAQAVADLQEVLSERSAR